MKSLKLLKNICFDSFKDVLSGTQAIAVDCDTGHLYFATKHLLVCINPEKNEIVSEIPLSEFVNENDEIIGLQHLHAEMSFCLALASGDILMYQVGPETMECVGSVSAGVLAMCWSPDHELVVLVSGEKTITLMNREFDPITEIDLHPDDFGEAKFVNVGWGKKETQFHGSEGKEAAKVKPEFLSKATDNDDGRVRVSWRGDGQYFAISCLHRSEGRRVIRTWTREGSHHSTSENVNGLEHALDWKPGGSLIASTQQLPQKHIVRFFERNGLIHGDFIIEGGAKVRELKWNNDSNILALWYERENEHVLQLWTVNNYHWYLKQEIVQKSKIGGFIWDSEHPYRLHLWLENWTFLTYEWAWSTFISHAPAEIDQSTVAVIDGSEVLMTSFKMAVVPPPIAGYKLKLPNPVQEVTFCPMTNQAAILTSKKELFVHEIVKVCDERTVEAGKSVQFDLSSEIPECLSLSHVTFVDTHTLLFVSQKPERKSELHIVKLEEKSKTSTITVEGIVLAIHASLDRVAVQIENGQVFDFKDGNLTPWSDSTGTSLKFPQACARMEICTINDETVVLGLTNRYRFYVNSLEIATNCTSFNVHVKFVLLTTLSHTIRCIPRSTNVKDLVKLADDKAHPFDECVRRVERGSQIVTSVSGGTSVVLQMPRGNLETIHPRALVLTSVRDKLDESEYHQAFILMKKHRINMNLIHDHNPCKFLNETELFVKQIGKTDSLNIFLTELHHDDVTVTMYDAVYKERKSTKPNLEKVDIICEKMRESLITVDRSKFFLSILTCFVKKRRPDLESALFEIRKLKDSDVTVTLDDAMKYLLYLVDVNQLFDIALGTYDFNLVLMVAEKSQKDPKEYLPLLNQLRNMEENYRKFTVDKMLKRHSDALRNIAKCEGKFDECMKLVEECQLHTEALTLFERGSESYKQIAKSQGLFLEEKKLYEESGLAFWKAEEWESGINVFTKSLSWRECHCLAQSANLPASRKQELSRDLSEKLKSTGRFQEAGQILEILQDYEESIATLIEGEVWSEALNLIYRHNRLDFIETNLKPKMLESLEHHNDQLPEMRAQFENYYSRLCTVRTEKERRHFELISESGYNDADGDLYSDISSASGDSFMSKRTQSSFFSTSSRTNRAKRKAERKKFSMKHGSPTEDLALVDALLKLINRVEQLKTEIGPLLKILVLFDKTTEAQKLQGDLVKFLESIKKKIPEIWLEEENIDEIGSDSTAQSIALAAQQRREILKVELYKEPTLRSPPVLKNSQEWKMRTLKSGKS